MHYCNWNIGDYASHTSHLTPLEDIAYRRILDLYYLHERPLNGCSTDVARSIRMREHEAEVASVLREFFTLDPARGWVQNRAEKEIAELNKKRRSAAKAGKASGKARREPSNGRSTTVQQPLNERATEPARGVEPPIPIPIPIPIVPEERAAAREPRSVVPPKPEDVTDQTWSDWLAHRRRKRAIVNETVLAEFRREAAAADVKLEEALKVSVAQGWQGFRADWVKGTAGKATNANGRPVIAASRIHMQNMPLGSPTCECAECVSFRSRKAQ